MKLSLALEEYILQHIQEEPDVLKQLDRETHLTSLYSRMLSGHVQGQILNMLCKMINPRLVLELGTFTGYSAISMGLALVNDAKLHTIEINDEKEAIINKYIAKAGLEKIITCHIGDALKIIPSLEGVFDLVFIDANKRDYVRYYHAVFDKIKHGGYIIADNVLWDGKVVEPEMANDLQTKGIIEFNKLVKEDKRVEKVIFPIRDGMTLIRKI